MWLAINAALSILLLVRSVQVGSTVATIMVALWILLHARLCYVSGRLDGEIKSLTEANEAMQKFIDFMNTLKKKEDT